MQSIWHGIRWITRKLIFLITLAVATTGILMFRSGLQRELPMMNGRALPTRFHWNLSHWWSVVSAHLAHLMKGQLTPPHVPMQYGLSSLDTVPMDLLATLPITLKLIGTAFVASLVIGMLVGLMLSLFAPAWLRATLWGMTTTLHAVPDMVLACLLDLGLVIIAIARGGVGPTQGSVTWQKYLAPSLGVTLLVVPYIARLTAAAIDEVSVQQYVRAAVARGVHPGRVLFVHIGKNVLIQVWTALPIIASLLVSGTAMMEYMVEVHGAGRAMLMAVLRSGDGYEASVYVLPMLVLFTMVLALSDGGQRLLDPRVGGESGGRAQRGSGVRTTWTERLAALRPDRLWNGVRDAGTGIVIGMWEGIVNLPGAAVRWGRALKDPVLLVGVIGVAGLVGVAIFAPHIAPFAPDYRIPITTDASGQLLVPPFLPGKVYRLGTDDLGRDILSRLIYGTRYALLFTMLVVPARFGLAAITGLLAAFRGGISERLISWFGTFFTAVPQVLIPLALIPTLNLIYMNDDPMALFWGVLLVALPGIPRLASAIRQQALEVMALPFVEGAQALGASTPRTIFRHILPQMGPQLATMVALEVPAVLSLTAVLGYFRANPGGAIFDSNGFKPVAPIIPEWGSLMENPIVMLLANKWWMWAPFVALFVAVLAFNLLGEGLRRQWASRTGWRWQ